MLHNVLTQTLWTLPPKLKISLSNLLCFGSTNQSISYLQWINPYLSCIRRCYSCRMQKECSNNVNITGKNSLSNVQWKLACINHKLRSNSASKSYNSKYVLKNKESFLIQSQNVQWLIFCCRMEKCCSFNQPTRWPCYFLSAHASAGMVEKQWRQRSEAGC